MSSVERDLASSERAGGARRAGAGPGAPGPSLEGRLVRRLLAYIGDPPIEFVLWDGERIGTSPEPVGRIRIHDRSTLFRLLRDPQMQFGDAYGDGSVTIDGDLVRLLETVYARESRSGARLGPVGKIGSVLERVRSVNTLTGSRENIHHHYDISNEFFSLWLGSTMAYTCAYYPTGTETLDEAQVAKMDHVCRKLRLQRGETVVEAGCGWGALALHMARHYGVTVRSFNISQEQIAFARERAKREGLDSQVEYVQDDYRNIDGRYDAFVSVGMLEHVGVENYPELGRVIRRSIGSTGRGLIHSLGRNRPQPLHPWLRRRIFPGGHAPSITEMMQIFEPHDLSVLDIENLRLHYARTLTHWLELFDASEERVTAMFDERFVRTWRLYLAGSIASLTTGAVQLFQVVFAPGESNDVPWSRAHVYPR